MTPEKITSVIKQYKHLLEHQGVVPKRIDTRKNFKACSESEIRAHVLYLCNNALTLVGDHEQHDKLNRHLGAMQMLLSSIGMYTLDELMNHNRPTT